MKINYYNKFGDQIKKSSKTLRWIDFTTEKKFDHYMLKEIYEQPMVSKLLIDSLNTEQSDIVEKFIKAITEASKVVFIAAGSSYYASSLGAYLLRKLGIEAYAVIASEYDEWVNYDNNTTVIAVSQSGETMDVILALKNLKNKVKKILSVVNVPYSTIQRMSDCSLEIKAGPEKCVAATKTYMNQVITFYYLARELGFSVNIDNIPSNIQKIIEWNEKNIIDIAKELKGDNDIYILGRGLNYFASLEIALKLKEIAYIHAEALPAGELKHGTLALIEPGTKVIALSPSWDSKVKTNIEEVKSRGGVVLNIPEDFKFTEYSYEFPIYSVVIGQLLTYYIAKEKGLPIDKPRNLAKSVTVI